MKSGHKSLFLIAILLASIATPLAVRYHSQTRLRELNASLRVQSQRLASLREEHERLSAATVRRHRSQSASSDELEELARLRDQIAQLSTRSNMVRQLQEENERLEALLEAAARQPAPLDRAEFERRLSAETIGALENISRELPSAMQRFAIEHPGKTPADLSDLAKYFTNANVGLYSFEFVTHPPALAPASRLLLRENRTRRTPEGKWRCAYAFADGRIIEHVVDDPKDFSAWEQRQTVPAIDRPK